MPHSESAQERVWRLQHPERVDALARYRGGYGLLPKTCCQPSPMLNTLHSLPTKEEGAPSVVLNLRQENGVWRGTMTIGQESFEDCLISSVTASSWVVDEKTQIYIAVQPNTLTIPPLGHGIEDTEAQER